MKLSLFFAALFALSAVGAVSAQEQQSKSPYDSYKGISIGMKTVDVRTKLGKPKDESDAEDDYNFSDSESVRIFYDADKSVRVISVMYVGNLKSCPEPKTILGTDIAAKPDGGLRKTVQYPKAGFWVSYVKTGGDDPIVMITMQRMAKEN